MLVNRREFLAGTAALVGAAGLQQRSDAAPVQNRAGANDRLNIAVIGVNGQGRGHVGGYANRHNCVVSHICDVDSAVIGRAMETARKQQGREPIFVQDLRRIMDNKEIHAVSIATPNHWHALAAIWAMQAGKDVYVEKPVSHNIWEGRRIVEVARQTNRICQTGTQIRSGTGVREAIEFIHTGKLGKVRVARGLCYKTRNSIGRVKGPQTPPKSMDYDLWCGPAPNNPPRRNTKNGPVHYEWHWIWDYGNGDLGNQGIHQMDVARWALGKNELARSVISLGGRFGYVDDGETPNTQMCLFDYGDAELIFEVRGLSTKPYRGAGVGNVIHCTDGYMVFPNYNSAIAYDLKGTELRRFSGSGDHFGNFVSAVRSRRSQDLKADILEGHLSSALCHLANISYRLGRPQAFDQRTKAFGDNKDAYETLERTQEHLRDNKVPLDKANYQLGRRLTIDPKTERFVGDDDANRQLTREYRKGFVVPARS